MPEARTPDNVVLVVADTPGLSLERTGETAKGGIEGVLRSPDGDFKMTATPEGWAELERDVAAGHNPVVPKPAELDGGITR